MHSCPSAVTRNVRHSLTYVASISTFVSFVIFCSKPEFFEQKVTKDTKKCKYIKFWRAQCGLPGGLNQSGGNLPHFDFQLQIDSELLSHLGPRQIDQPLYVGRGGPRVGDDEIRVAIADFGVADPGAP